MIVNVIINELGFSPKDIIIYKNTIVVWTNQDESNIHSIASIDTYILFTINNLDIGVTSNPIVFSNIGIFKYFDPLNPGKRGTITVIDHYSPDLTPLSDSIPNPTPTPTSTGSLITQGFM